MGRAPADTTIAFQKLSDTPDGTVVTDAEGRPLDVYHQTPALTKTFSKRNANYGQVGHWFHTQPHELLSSSVNSSTPHEEVSILRCHLSIRNPREFSDIESFKIAVDGKYGSSVAARAQKFRRDAKEDGYDGIWIRAGVQPQKSKGPSEIWIAFDGSQVEIKSMDQRSSGAHVLSKLQVPHYDADPEGRQDGQDRTYDRLYQLDLTDQRDFVMQSISIRRGQPAFRNALLQRYGRCVISGCTASEVLEAAHIDPYRGRKQNHIDNGLLLRADLHILFDLNLLSINPDTLLVRVHPNLDAYRGMDRQTLRLPDHGPDLGALRRRWQVSLAAAWAT